MADPIQVLGIDLGGTAIKLGRFRPDGTCLRAMTVPTPQPALPESVLITIVDAISELDPDRQACAIGIGMPGPADAKGRIARIAINLPNWIEVPLADWIEEKTGRPTILSNDANCAGLGEAWLGAGRAFQNFILLTLGTGVGGAILLNGELFIGQTGAAGELGLISLDAKGSPCKSGNRGSLEQHTSILAIRRRTGKEPEELGQLARSGNSEALEFWRSYGRDLGVGLTSLIYVLAPEAVVIGGGVSASAEFFLPSAIAEIEQRVMPTSREGLQVIPAELGNQAGMIGAAKLVLNSRYIENCPK
ncbi:MAG: ROK family protein [Leptolyngbya sp. Prado105]|jgi:glucokinase|nr:ROK family protein [Leptolyngbya sp. Prado105]